MEMNSYAVAKGLARHNLTLYLAAAVHRTHKNKPIDFAHYPYLRGIYEDTSRLMGVMKSTQCGISEYILVREIAKALSGLNIFHVLPTDNLVGRFVRERFDKSIEYTPRYQRAIKKKVDTVKMKQIGSGTISIVGSYSDSSFTEFPADEGIIDEVDKCDQENILKVEDRLANSEYRSRFTIGNPTITDFGIHRLFKNSKQYRWYIRCPKCHKWFNPNFFNHVVIQDGDNWMYRDASWERGVKRDPYPIHECGQIIDRTACGEWSADYPDMETSFYHISKMFSTRVTVGELCAAFSNGLDNDEAMMRFYNSDLGLPYTPRGSKLIEEDLNNIVENYALPDFCSYPCVMGIDVGVKLHVRINQILGDGRERAVFIGTVPEKEDIEALCTRYNIVCGVIDAMPEIRLARDISYIRQFFRCTYHSEKTTDKTDPLTKRVGVNRTEILDAVVSKIRERRLEYPRNAGSLPELYQQMTALTRVFNEDRQEYQWLGADEDHYFHAEAYATLARRIIMSVI
jgi:hypothetical protein